MRSVRFALVTMGLLGCISGGADAQQPIPLKPMTVQGDFAVSEGTVATDISGMACLPEGTPRTCLLVNDENKNAQFATIQDDRMVVGDPVPLIGSAPDSRTLGRPPDETCEKADDFRDLDGEGVAYAAPYFYVVGSHGCGRSKGKFRLSSFILARVRVDRQGQPVDSVGRSLARDKFAQAVETTYRVSDLLKRAGKAAAFFGKDLESADGLNIEGVAVQGDTIWSACGHPSARTKPLIWCPAISETCSRPETSEARPDPKSFRSSSMDWESATSRHCPISGCSWSPARPMGRKSRSSSLSSIRPKAR